MAAILERSKFGVEACTRVGVVASTPGAGTELYAFICIGETPFLYGSIGTRL